MPTVPSAEFVPSVAPTEAATPSERINAPEAAFGGASAAATEGLGTALERSGNEIFARAVALQQLQNETEARDGDTKYMMQAGELHAKFNSLEGEERVKAFPKYAQDLQETRAKIRGALSNPMAMKMYDASSLSTMGRSIFNGAGAAATANKEWAHGAVNAQHDLLVKGVYDDPQDDSAFRQAIVNNHQTATTRAALTPGGASPERIELMTRTGDSTIAANRVLGMVRNQPYQASQMLKQYKDEGLLFGKDYESVSNKVESLTQTIGTQTIANQVLGKYVQQDGSYSKSAADMQDEAVKQAATAYPDDPKMESAARAAFDRNYNQHQWAVQQDKRDVDQQVAGYITKGVSTTEMLPPDLLKRMSPQQIKAFPGQANTYQKSIDTQTNQAAYEKFLGLYNNDNGAFMEKDFMTEPGLNKSNRDYFMRLQRTTAANGDPRVGKAMSWLKGYAPQTLDDLGITGKAKDPDTSNRFVGALHDAIQGWQETNGKPPNETQLTKEIYPNLLTKATDPHWYGDSKTEFFRAPIPQAIIDNAVKQKGDDLTPIEQRALESNYNRAQFNQLFGGKAKSQDKVQ